MFPEHYLVIIVDVISTIGFGAAALAALRKLEGISGTFLTLSMAVYFIVGCSNVFEHTGVFSTMDRYEDFMEIVAVPFFLFFVFSWQTDREMRQRVEAEQEVRTLNENLERLVAERTAALQSANSELESFCYSVSHDLRAPLRHIDGFSQILLEEYRDGFDEEGCGYLDRMRAATVKMEQLIDDLLNLSRVTRAEMSRQEVDLSRMASDIAAELERGAPTRAVRWEIAANLRVSGDERLLRVALDNLLGNAWKYTLKTPSPHIEFGTVPAANPTVYFVRDNGAGFDMAYVGKLFAPFQRLHTATEFEGTGIGLATVQRIISRHGGRVWAEGAVENGATVFFTLP